MRKLKAVAAAAAALAKLQDAPYKANAATGGSAALAAGLDADRRSSDCHDPGRVAAEQLAPPALAQLQAPLVEFYAVLDQVYAIGVSPGGYNAEAGRPCRCRHRARQEKAVGSLDAAGDEYAARAHQMDTEATFGAAAAILLLVAAFAFLYTQNRRLLEASRREALSDPLTGLANRRAFQNDLRSSARSGKRERPATAPRALRPRRLQAVQRHLRPPRR